MQNSKAVTMGMVIIRRLHFFGQTSPTQPYQRPYYVAPRTTHLFIATILHLLTYYLLRRAFTFHTAGQLLYFGLPYRYRYCTRLLHLQGSHTCTIILYYTMKLMWLWPDPRKKKLWPVAMATAVAVTCMGII
jgi:hypothetical protein